MIPFKEVKELLYRLFEERFLKIQVSEEDNMLEEDSWSEPLVDCSFSSLFSS